MKGYTKLHAKLVLSSIWRQPDHVRLLWITVLALADENGVVEASVGGLADMARLSVEATRDALSALCGPDEDSSDGGTGERLEAVQGGWLVLNHANYRERQTPQRAATAERVRQHRARVSETPPDGVSEVSSVTPDEFCNGVKRRPASASASASASVTPEAETTQQPDRPDTARGRRGPVPRPADVDAETWADWLDIRKRHRAPLTHRAWQAIEQEVAAAGWSRQRAITECITRGWRAFKADWVQRDGDKKSAGPRNMDPKAISGSAVEAARRAEERQRQREQDRRVGGLVDGVAAARGQA